jgi:hypothetical protein
MKTEVAIEVRIEDEGEDDGEDNCVLWERNRLKIPPVQNMCYLQYAPYLDCSIC